jgi:PAS domain-containing protein
MKKPQHMTKAELVKCIKRMEKGAPATRVALERERRLHELQVYQVELEAQNRQLRGAQSLLEAARDRYANLYDFAPVGFVTLDGQGVISEINLAAAGLLG